MIVDRAWSIRNLGLIRSKRRRKQRSRTDDHYKLKGLGDVSEMGDAVLGFVIDQMGDSAPPWVAVRNVSDLQIKAEGTLAQQAKLAAQIYKAYGR